MLDLPNLDDVSNTGVPLPEASVSTPEDVCNRMKKNLTGFEKDTFLPRVSCQRDNAPPIFVLLKVLIVLSAVTNSGAPAEELRCIQYKKSKKRYLSLRRKLLQPFLQLVSAPGL